MFSSENLYMESTLLKAVPRPQPAEGSALLCYTAPFLSQASASLTPLSHTLTPEQASQGSPEPSHLTNSSYLAASFIPQPAVLMTQLSP